MKEITVEAMTGRAERFFQNKTQFPKERYPIVTVSEGEVLGGFLYYRDPKTGIMGVYLEGVSSVWFNHETLAKLVEFPFYSLGVKTVITTISNSPQVASLCRKTGGIVLDEQPVKVVFTRENALAAAKSLRGNV